MARLSADHSDEDPCRRAGLEVIVSVCRDQCILQRRDQRMLDPNVDVQASHQRDEVVDLCDDGRHGRFKRTNVDATTDDTWITGPALVEVRWWSEVGIAGVDGRP